MWFFEICHRKIGHYHRCRRKSINKQINALQEELGRLREEMKNTRAFLKDIEREFVHCLVGEE